MSVTEQVLLIEDLEPEQPNPFRRRQKVIGVRRRGLRRFAKAAKWSLEILLLALCIAGARWALHRAVESPLLRFQPARDVTVTGNHVVPSSDIVNAIGLGETAQSLATPILQLDLTSIRRRVERIPWVKSASITRIFPDRLRVTVVERTPVAYASIGGRIELVDQDGILLDMRRGAESGFPVIYGLSDAEDASVRKERLAPYLRFITSAKGPLKDSGWSVSEADVSNPDDLRVLLVKGPTTVLARFGSRNYLQRAESFISVVPRILARSTKINSIDLRFRDEVVVDPAGAAQQNVTATGASARPPTAAVQRVGKP